MSRVSGDDTVDESPTTSSTHSLRLREIELSSLDVFKVVGNQNSVLEYCNAHPPRVVGEWSAIYFQFNEPHALGTVGYRWDMGYTTARLIRLTLRCVTAIIADAAWFPDGEMTGDAKAAFVKAELGIPDSEQLMEAMAKRQRAFVCRETADQWELVLSPSMLEALATEEEVVLELAPNEYGMTGLCRRSKEDPWVRFQETDALQEVPPPAWISESLYGNPAPKLA